MSLITARQLFSLTFYCKAIAALFVKIQLVLSEDTLPEITWGIELKGCICRRLYLLLQYYSKAAI